MTIKDELFYIDVNSLPTLQAKFDVTSRHFSPRDLTFSKKSDIIITERGKKSPIKREEP